MKMHEEPPPEISHDAHPAHRLKLVTSGGGPPFRCDGCKEPGTDEGRRYRCAGAGCDFDLHVCCALAAPALRHPLLGDDLEFELLPSAPPGAAAAVCSACGCAARGLVYHCSTSRKKGGGLYLHPSCAALRMERVLHDDHHAQLCGEAKLRCVICGEKGHSRAFSRKQQLWAYRWRYGSAEGYLHVACAKRIAVQSWEQAYLQEQEGGVLEASVPIMKGVLQVQGRRSPGDDQSSGGLELAVGGVELVGNIISAASSSN